jgi:hypothetical protein
LVTEDFWQAEFAVGKHSGGPLIYRNAEASLVGDDVA